MYYNFKINQMLYSMVKINTVNLFLRFDEKFNYFHAILEQIGVIIKLYVHNNIYFRIK